mmetsp:Transcript_14671/g.12909  ORF Transcript_14671/g.12909 Transcript_14671/m.12909 type:complete len:245 (+) Transcript_14671:34-768(+)
MAEDLTIYTHVLSPFGAFVVATANHLNIPHTEHSVDLSKNEHKQEWFLKINPKGQVPAIKEGDKCMSESFDICVHLIKSRKIETTLWPEDEKEQQEMKRVLSFAKDSSDSARDLVLKGYFDRLLKGVGLTDEKFRSCQVDVYETYQKYEDHLTEKGTRYFTNDEHYRLGDFLIYILLYSFIDKGLLNLDNYPKLKGFFEDMDTIGTLKTCRNRAYRLLRLVNFLGNYIFPVVRCLTCKRRRALD